MNFGVRNGLEQRTGGFQVSGRRRVQKGFDMRCGLGQIVQNQRFEKFVLDSEMTAA